MLALLGDASSGALLALRTPVIGGHRTTPGWSSNSAAPSHDSVRARTVISAAGLGAVPLARGIRGLRTPGPMPASPKGSFTSCYRNSRLFTSSIRFRNPEDWAFILTLDLAGQARFGPDVEWLTEPDYHVSDENPRAGKSIRRYWPGLGDGLA